MGLTWAHADKSHQTYQAHSLLLGSLDIQIAHLFGIGLNELPPGFHLLSHEHGKDFLSRGRAIDRNLFIVSSRDSW